MRTLITLIFLALVLLLVIPVKGPKSVRAVNLTHTCEMCHNTHSAKGERLIRGHSVDGLCLSCHGPGGGSVLQAAAHARAMNLNQGAPKPCTACHLPHGGGIQPPLFTPLAPPGWQPPTLLNQ